MAGLVLVVGVIAGLAGAAGGFSVVWTGVEDGTACAAGKVGEAGNQAGCVGATGLLAMARAAGLRLGAMGVIGAFKGVLNGALNDVLKGAFTGELGGLVNCGLKGVDSGALLGAGRAAALA